MGCGISTLDTEDAPMGRRRNNRVRQHGGAIAPPVADNNKKYNYENDDDGVVVVNEEAEAKMKEDGFKSVVDRKEKEERVVFINEDRDDSIIGPGSPSFRDYCNDYDSGDRSSVGDSNDCDSGESAKNGSEQCDDDSTNRPRNEKSVNFNKEPEKIERTGRGFRNVINNKGKTRGKRNLLNFACYNSSTTQSYAEGSFKKIVGKTG